MLNKYGYIPEWLHKMGYTSPVEKNGKYKWSYDIV